MGVERKTWEWEYPKPASEGILLAPHQLPDRAFSQGSVVEICRM